MQMTTTIMILIGLAFWLPGIFGISKALEKRYFTPDPERKTPGVALRDDFDYYPANPYSLFGDHWAATAGGAPLKGGIFISQWGWLGGILYVLPVNIFLGSVHDYACGFVTQRQRGDTPSLICSKMISKRAGLLFVFLGWLAIVSFNSAFTLAIGVTAAKFTPEMALPMFVLCVMGPPFGYLLYRKGWPLYVIAIIEYALMSVMVYLGTLYPIKLPFEFWLFFLAVVGIIAACVPNWIYTEPTNFMMFLFMASGVVILFVGGLISNVPLKAPMLIFYDPQLTPNGWFYPGIAMVVSCGALTGMHAFWIGAYTTKRFPEERWVRIIGYGGEILESVGLWTAFLSMLVLTPEEVAHAITKIFVVVAYGEGFAKIVSPAFPFLSFEGWKIFAIWVFVVFMMSTFFSGYRNLRVLGLEFAQEITGKRIVKHPVIARWISAIVAALVVTAFAATKAYKWLWPMFPILSTAIAVFTWSMVIMWCKIHGKGAGYWWAAFWVTLLLIATPAGVYYTYMNAIKGGVYMVFAAVGFLAVIFTWWFSAEFWYKLKKGFKPEEIDYFRKREYYQAE